MKYARLLKTSAIALTIASASVMAANDGTLGSNSTGDLDITLTVGNLFSITKLNDITLTTDAATGNAIGDDDFCIYANTASGDYKITMNGNWTSGATDTAGTDFTLNSTGVGSIDYSVDFTGSSTSTMTATTDLNQTSANTTATNCGSAAAVNASIDLTVTAADLAGATQGTYLGTLTMVVAAQ